MACASDLLVEIDSVSKWFDVKTTPTRWALSAQNTQLHRISILEDASLQIFRGQIITLFGSSGGGKTTFLRLLAGVSVPTEGQIRCYGRIARMIDHSVLIDRRLTLVLNLKRARHFFGFSAGRSTEIAHQILLQIEATKYEDLPIQYYPQIVQLRLFAILPYYSNAELVLNDGHLPWGDPDFDETFWGIVEKHKQSGGATLISVRDERATVMHSDRLIELKDGRLIEAGQPIPNWDSGAVDTIPAVD